MKEIAIIGAGMTKFGEHWNKSFKDLINEACHKAMAGINWNLLDEIFIASAASGSFIAQEHLGALITESLGLNIPATRFEAACASGGVALRQACINVASGTSRAILVCGCEKMTDVASDEVSSILGMAGDSETELFNGATFPALYALIARLYMFKYNISEKDLAEVSVKNHTHALKNNYAQFHKKITIEDVLKSPVIAEPLKLLDCSPVTDGAAAVVVTTVDIAKQLGLNYVKVLAYEQANDTISLAGREEITSFKSTLLAAKKAYEKANIKAEQIEVLEVHDCFSIAEIIALEDLGLFEKGKSIDGIKKGLTTYGGKYLVNPSGGLKACGHPVGATGIKQAVEIYWQLTNQEGRINNKRIGLTHNIGGSGATCVIHIFQKANNV